MSASANGDSVTATQRAPVLLRLEAVTKRWNGRPVLSGVDLDLTPGAIVGVAGSNGAGKTTLLRIACGLLIPEAGRVHLRGVDIESDRTSYYREVGLLSAGDRGLYARLTVRQNLAIWGGLTALARAERRSRIDQVLAEFELEELADRRVDRLSMGQRQRVRLAMTFLHRPTIVFLDEPRTSLDDEGVSLLEAALGRLVRHGGTGLWVSPDVSEPLVTETWMLHDGQLRPHGGRRASAEPSGRRPAVTQDPVTPSVVAS
jgi:ABC-2 type transport system ATP-binding protein